MARHCERDKEATCPKERKAVFLFIFGDCFGLTVIARSNSTKLVLKDIPPCDEEISKVIVSLCLEGIASDLESEF